MRFLIQQKYFSIREGFYIRDAGGRDTYYVKGKIFSLGKQLTIFDAAGREAVFIKQRPFRLLGTFDIYQKGVKVARIKRTAMPFVKRYRVTSDTYGDMTLRGNVFAWDFSIFNNRDQAVAQISKKVLRVRDTYAVDIYDNRLEPLILGIAIIIDVSHHRKH